MADNRTTSLTDAPATYRTARRPGQSGAPEQRRSGPSPLSPHPTGPHAPFEEHESDGAAAIKHEPASEASPADGRRSPP
ncbi:hypothetical protein [Bosea sp. (in: a-proteobacteria)]|uniref:hypothetical protein n=1 Tax=Bosea sp. (in: a-proteobacteria) TaxID=1871050 RepID=UPI002FC93BAF